MQATPGCGFNNNRIDCYTKDGHCGTFTSTYPFTICCWRTNTEKGTTSSCAAPGCALGACRPLTATAVWPEVPSACLASPTSTPRRCTGSPWVAHDAPSALGHCASWLL